MAVKEFTVLDDSINDIDTSDQLEIIEAYQKAFIVNGENKKVVDLINVKLTYDTGLTVAHANGDIITQAGTNAKMIVDYTSSDKKATYGFVIEGTFNDEGEVTGVNGGTPFVPDDVINPPHWYDWTTYPGAEGEFGELPNKLYIVALSGGRVWVSGNPDDPNQTYASRWGVPWDFNYLESDALAAFSTEVGQLGKIDDIVRAIIPCPNDDYTVIGCLHSISYFVGNPKDGGGFMRLPTTVGIFGARSWCIVKDTLYFWASTGGLYRTTIPGIPECVSDEPLPNMFENEDISPATHRVILRYDKKRQGILICATRLSDGINSNFFYDLVEGGFFPENYPKECGVYSACYLDANNQDESTLLLGCKDGYIREFDENTKSDNVGVSTQPIDSYVAFGPLRGNEIDRETDISNLAIVSAGGLPNHSQPDSDNIDYGVYIGDTAEEVIEKLDEDATPVLAGTFKGPGRFRGSRDSRKVRGAFIIIWVGNSEINKVWAMERLIFDTRPARKLR